MADWRIERYNPTMAGAWDAAAGRARNASFLFRRGYMDYHADRFVDFSLVASNAKSVALLPANLTADDATLHSHQGLTFGGWLLPEEHVDGQAVLELFEALADFCHSEGIKAIDYKPMPYIYAQRPSQEDLYALWRMGAAMCGANLSSVADLRNPVRFNSQQRRNLKKAEGVQVHESADLRAYWQMLEECLAARHDAAPVHSLAEMEMLRARFPENIRLFTVCDGSDLLGGTLMYISPTVARCQYIASTAEGRNRGALARLFFELMEQRPFGDVRYLDFGTSNADDGRVLDAGLLHQKFGFGATGVVFPRYKLQL